MYSSVLLHMISSKRCGNICFWSLKFILCPPTRVHSCKAKTFKLLPVSRSRPFWPEPATAALLWIFNIGSQGLTCHLLAIQLFKTLIFYRNSKTKAAKPVLRSQFHFESASDCQDAGLNLLSYSQKGRKETYSGYKCGVLQLQLHNTSCSCSRQPWSKHGWVLGKAYLLAVAIPALFITRFDSARHSASTNKYLQIF